MNTIKPLLSIIIPSYNQGEFIERTLKSIFQQDCSRVEVIVMDGGSNDNSTEILKKYKNQINHLHSEKDRGQSHAFNKGLALAKGEWVGWQNSDDCYIEDSFSDFFEIIENNQDYYDVIFSDFEIIGEYDQVIYRRKLTSFSALEYVILGGTINNCSVFFRKEKLIEVNGLDEHLHHCMDHDLYLKLSKISAKFHHVKNSIWGQFRIHEGSKGSTETNAKSISLEVRRRYFPWYNNNSVLTIGLSYIFNIRKVAILIFRHEWKFLFYALKKVLFK